MPSHIVRPFPARNAKFKKRSSPAARRLIEAAVARYGSEVKAARALGLANSTQLNKMRKGTLRDTPAMRAALLKARERARRAWLYVPEARTDGAIDHDAVMAALTMLDNDFEMLVTLLKPKPR